MEGSAATIVIVEDDNGVARLQQKRLQRAGYLVQTFAHPQDALAVLHSGAVDLMILDYRLLSGGQNGLEFYEELKRSGIDVPAILVTGFANESLIIAAMRAGMKDFVSKSAEYLDYMPEAVGRVLRQRQIERRLAETEARFETMFRHSPIGIGLQILADGRFIDVNDAFLKIIGCSRAEVIGATSIELGILPPDINREEMFRTLRSGESIRPIEVELRNRLGRQVAIELAAEPINLHGMQCILSLVQDITERRRSQQELRLQKRAIDAAGEGITIADATLPDMPLVFVNEAFEALTGYAQHEALGRNCRFLQGADTDRAVVQQLREGVRAGRPVNVEVLNYRKDGTPFWNLLSVTPVRDGDGAITHFVGVQRDVTERRLVGEQLRQSQKMEAIGRLAGGIAHDFNNILTIILGDAELALEDLAERRDPRGLIEEIIQTGHRAAGLTRQLLAFSRKQVLEPRVVDLNGIVREAERLLHRVIGEDVLLSTALGTDLYPIKVDPVQLEQILINVTVNARDAMPLGGKLILETQNVQLDRTHGLEGGVRPGRYVMLAISDTGQGMDAETKARIFEPFFTTKERGRGTGLGLSTVYGIVQQSGGYVWVYSEVGHGTTLKIYLPEFVSGEEESMVKPAARATARGTETLLLVEDESMVRAIAKRMLEGGGYRVLEARNGAEALQAAEVFAEPIDLLVTDVIMPGMTGRQLAQSLVATRPQTRVLYVSGYTDHTILQHGVLEAGVAFLQKPFSHDSLLYKVREVLDAKRG